MEVEGIFVRPASVPKGVWGRHGTIRIEDIPEDRKEEVVKFMMDNFMKDEPVSSIITKTAPYSNEDIRTYLIDGLNDNVSLFALDEANNDKLVGVSTLRVSSRCAPDRHKMENMQLTSTMEVLTFIKHCLKDVDIFTYELDNTKVVVNYILEPIGLSVVPEYRGKGIARALIKARHELAAAVGIGATNGIYTSIYSQTAILHYPSMKTFKEIPYSEYLVNGNAKYASLNPPHPSAKVIGGLITKDMAYN